MSYVFSEETRFANQFAGREIDARRSSTAPLGAGKPAEGF
jgi:hypothetical protein